MKLVSVGIDQFQIILVVQYPGEFMELVFAQAQLDIAYLCEQIIRMSSVVLENYLACLVDINSRFRSSMIFDLNESKSVKWLCTMVYT